MSSELPAPAPDRGTWPKAVPLLVLAGLLAYCNSFTKAFVFDDVPWITNNSDIGDFGRYTSGWSRSVVRVTLWLNYKLGGLNPTGYHAFNLGVHVLAALALFGIVRRAARAPRFAGRYDRHADHLAFAVALLWLVHPLQTQAVTYVIQRFESMMGLFYLFAVYAWTRAATGGARAWYAAALGSFALSAGCKEVAVTLPLVLVAYDRVFLAASWRDLGKRWPAYLGLLAVWGAALAPVLQTTFGANRAAAGEAGVGFEVKTVTPWTYLLTQSEVILHYLRLSVWPKNQALDYLDWPIAKSIGEVWPSFLAVAALAAGSFALLYLRPALGFVGFWFFVILAPTSSVLPIIDPAYEHRMYLSLAAVMVVVVFGTYALLAGRGWSEQKLGVFGFTLLAGATVVLISLTFARNETYRSQVACLTAAADARPNNPRSFTSLAALHLMAGDLDRSEAAVDRAEQLVGRTNMILRQRAPLAALRGRFPEAERLYLELITTTAFNAYVTPVLYRNLIWVRVAMGKLDAALASARELVKLQPQEDENQLVLAAMELANGHPAEARAAAAEAKRLDPNSPRNTAAQSRAIYFGPTSSSTPFFKPRAMWQAAAACLADGNRDPALLDTLAMVYAWNGRFPDAAAAARLGIAAADAKSDTDWALALRARLKRYEAGKPYGKD